PPTSTPFPYTTLFRSVHRARVIEDCFRGIRGCSCGRRLVQHVANLLQDAYFDVQSGHGARRTTRGPSTADVVAITPRAVAAGVRGAHASSAARTAQQSLQQGTVPV